MRHCLLILLTSFCLATTAPAQDVFPLRISENSRHLTDANGKPFPIMGRTAWCVLSLPVNDYTKFIENTLSHGFRAIEISAMPHWLMGNNAPFNGRGEVPFLKQLNGETWKGSLKYTDTLAEAPDFTTPNEAYWQYVDSFLNYCHDKQLLVLMFPAYVGFEGGDQGWGQELVANGPDRVKQYGAWIAKRYKNQKNVVWMLLGDQGKLKPGEIEAQAALIAGLKSVEGQQSTLYTAESMSGQNARDQPDFGHEMNINGVYTWDSVGVPTLGRKAYSQEPAMPSFLLEEPYDEEGPDGNNYNPHAVQPVRRFAWWGWLTTIGGYVAGNGFIWAFKPGWEEHLNKQTVQDQARLNTFMQSIEWWKLVPSGLDGTIPVIVKGEGKDSSNNFVAAATDKEGTMLVAYIPPKHEGTITVDLTYLKGNITSQWFDPTSGKFTQAKGASISNKKTREFRVPGKNSQGENDWVLYITSKPAG